MASIPVGLTQKELAQLEEMGIPAWDVRNPQLYAEMAETKVDLPEQCQLLLITDDLLTEKDVELFGKILATMKLKTEQALCLPRAALPHLAFQTLAWCWVTGHELEETERTVLKNTRVLHSVAISAMHNDNQAKKYLWQQIKQYEN
ncbi:DNA polymerase III subunit psi [Parasalinivibrio latis]|uniref:DNA polymerase III subunit psi n=1 Tax=Parasalinivibrio latis TaxID=2952610 RepID=UPI0030E5F765